MTTSILSAQRIDDWRGCITLYRGALNTTPCAEHADLAWPSFIEVVCPKSGPQVIADKSRGTYFTPGLLRDAPLVGNTLLRAQREGRPTVGKQRSGTHTTCSAFLVFDMDGLEPELAKRINQGLEAAGVSFAAWTSWSFGRPEKPGIRARYAVPVDRPADKSEYGPAWHGANAHFFEGAADPTGAKLCQQQGVWAIGPDRVHLARRWGLTAGVASADALIGLAPLEHRQKPSMKSIANASRDWEGAPPSPHQIKAALAVLDPSSYVDWDMVVSLGVAISRGKGADVDAIKALVVEFSNRADEDRRAGNDRRQYDPSARFSTWQPSVSPSVAAATLFQTARDRATAIYRNAAKTGNFKGTRPSWSYLCAYHPQRWNEVRAETQTEETT